MSISNRLAATSKGASQYLPIQSFALSSADGHNSNVKLGLPNSTPIWGFGVDLGGRKNGANRNLVPTFLFDFYANYMPILHRLATIHNAADRRQTDRAIGIGENAT